MTVRSWVLRRPAWAVDLAAIAVAALAALVAGLVFLAPTLDARGRAAAMDAEEGKTAQDAEQTRAALRTARAELRDADAELARLRIDLRPAGELNTRLGAIAELAQSMGIELTQIEPQSVRPPGAGAAFQRVPIRLAGRTRDEGLGDLLAHVHAHYPDVAVTAFRVSAGPRTRTDGPPGEATFLIDLQWYAAIDGGAGRASPATAPAP